MVSSRIFGWLVVASLLAGCEAEYSGVSQSTKRHRADDTPLLSDSSELNEAPPCASSGAGTGPRALNCGAPIAAVADPVVPPTTIRASLAVTRHPDGAASTNCLKIQVNNGREVDLGCNKGEFIANVQIDALPKPACNVVRLILYSNGTKNRSTESADNVANDFRIAKLAKDAYAIQCNDNRDDDFHDLDLEISSADATLAIENTPFRCEM